MDVTTLIKHFESGELSVSTLAGAVVERINERESAINAWSYFNPKTVMEQAKALDNTVRRGPLHGVPVGVKDIIDTAGIPTSYGSAIYRDHVPTIDAAVVSATKAAGGLIVGKTVTAEFAHRAPGPTRNPLDTRRTPGGSSSGSAAAVADAMAALALGTQTGGSTIRPASYCGIVGYKPTFGIIGYAGVRPSVPSFDTMGLFGKSLADCAVYRDVLLARPLRLPADGIERPIRIGFYRTPFWEKVSPRAAERIEEIVSALRRQGADVIELETPSLIGQVPENQRKIASYEMAWSLAKERVENYAELSEVIRKGRLADSEHITYQSYIDAIELIEKARAFLSEWFGDLDCVISPSADGIAAIGLDETGGSEFCAIWTALRVPVVSVPLTERMDNMPLGIQVLSLRGQDALLFDCAQWIAARI
jgi:amidase